MKENLRQSMAWLHTWAGLLVGWILFMVFAAGTASYFRDEITLWMKPELHRAALAPVPQAVAAERAQAALAARAPGSRRWFITLPSARAPAVDALWVPAPKDGQPARRAGRRELGTATLDPATGQELDKARATRGGDFFFRLHFDLHYMSPLWGRWIVGACAMSMLVAILSGVITHRRIFKDFFTFRPRKGQRSWLDAHNATAVLALPYHLMITYTGLVTLMFMYLPAGVQAVYHDRTEAFYADLNGGPGEVERARVPAAPAPLGGIVDRASALWGGAPAGRIVVEWPGDANARVTVTRQAGHGISQDLPSLTFDGVSGRLLSDPARTSGGAVATRGVMYGLHVARFADPAVRALFFLSGLAGCAMVATGVLLWAVKERPKHLKTRAGRIGIGLRLVDGLNVGGIAGLLLAMAAYFWANRLVPSGIAGRPDVEIGWFFGVWGAALLAGLAWPLRRTWQVLLTLAGLAFALLPALNPLTGGAGLASSLRLGLWAVAGVDLVALALGLALLGAAWHLRTRPAMKARLAGSTA